MTTFESPKLFATYAEYLAVEIDFVAAKRSRFAAVLRPACTWDRSDPYQVALASTSAA